MIDTERLVLRGWTDDDRAPFHAMCTDPAVMAFIGPLQSRAESDAGIDRQQGLLAAHGHCFWAVERRDDRRFLGFCGLKPGAAGTPIEGEVEIGWRLAAAHWGKGYAQEAARASLAWGWSYLDVPGIAAIVAAENARSWGLMQRIGMRRAVDADFDHPTAIPALRRHRTYRIARP
ncbi:Acetyltransferase [Sphingomonas sp. S2M10]|uniref:GNAT family N-acetyltransferase n=1 Tax=Sphingomonas sp. S2M10 TaxID=2705010 RepID=UPI0014565605|nr:GNAT family N-acetyltransferase [Sphingomonas sp. S2M10]NLS28096.1 Acetyltransferase [Sphingomonas sp. S2M10]